VGLDVRARVSARPQTQAAGPTYTAEESIEELAALASSAGAEILASSVQSRPAVEAATLVGSGKVEELSLQVKALDPDVVIFDRELTPTQQRNLERALDCRVIDRTQLILDIFAGRARTREGQLQVELAQLNYLLPRLAGRGIQMSRLGGGIGTRGPGETQLETDRRRIYRRIRKVEQDLESVRASRGVQRRQRQSVPLATVALVGYTNAGKSTLFNRMTGAEVLADAKMFATLDPTVRSITLPSRRRVLLSDTVGFIRNLPTTLVEAFRATLEEVTEAALLLHVVDASSPKAIGETAHVLKVLAEIGAGAKPHLVAFNKFDLVSGSPEDRESVCRRLIDGVGGDFQARTVAVSARSGQGFGQLLATLDEVLPADPVSMVRLRIPLAAMAEVDLLHRQARVIALSYDEDGCLVEAEVAESLLRRLRQYVAEPGR
jgi:GTP-binding protein HflX